MPLLQDSLFTLWNTFKKSALGFSDQYPSGFEGLYVPFLTIQAPLSLYQRISGSFPIC